MLMNRSKAQHVQVHKSVRRRILAILRRAHRVLGMNRARLGLGQLGPGARGAAATLYSGGNLSSLALLVGAGMFAFSSDGQAQTMTWSNNPGTGEVSTSTNWTPAGPITNKTLNLGASSTTNLTFTQNTGNGVLNVNQINFQSGAPAYTVTIGGTANNSKLGIPSVSGTPTATPSIVNSSSVTQNFVIANRGYLGIRNDTTGSLNFDIRSGGTIQIFSPNSLAQSTVVNNGNLDVFPIKDAAGANIPANIGSLAGSGHMYINGAISVGALNTSTTYSGVIENGTASGGSPGRVIKVGTGVLTVTGDSKYSGGTTINGGVVAVAGNGDIGTGNVTINNGTFDISAANNDQTIGGLAGATGTKVELGGKSLTLGGSTDATYGGVINGTGGITKQGTGTQTLTEAQTYTGPTAVNDGKLVLADNGALDPASGVSVAGPATLDISAANGDRAIGSLSNGADGTGGAIELGANDLSVGGDNKDGTFAGVIDGEGGLSKDGTGTQTLTEAQTYTGPTAVNDGKLVLADNGALDPASGVSVAGPATLDISAANGDRAIGSLTGAEGSKVELGGNNLSIGNDDGDATFAGGISGTGGISKDGLGTATFSGVNSYTGDTLVNAGALILAPGASLASSVTVKSGASIGGSGRLGGLAFDKDATYTVHVDAAGQSDRLDVDGKAALNSAKVDVIAAEGNYKPSTTYTILSADGGLDGTFSSVNSNLAFLTPSLAYDANNVLLTMTRNDIKFGGIGQTSNQREVGSALDNLALPNPLGNAIVSLSADDAREAFDNLSGELYPSVTTGLIENSQLVATQINDHMRSALSRDGLALAAAPVRAANQTPDASSLAPSGGGLAVWGTGFGSWGHADSDEGASRFSRSTGGFVMGVDGHIGENSLVGLVGGYSNSSFKVSRRASSASSDNYHVGLYGATQLGNLAIRAGGTYTWSDVSADRDVVFPGFLDRLTGDYHARTAQVSGEVSYAMRTGSFALEPFAGLAYVNVDNKRLSEKGGAAALTLKGDSADVTFSTLGMRGAADFKLGSLPATVRGSVGWRHAFGDVTPVSLHSLAGSTAFSIEGVPVARDAAAVELGVNVNVSSAITVGVGYQGQFGSDATDHNVVGRLSIRF
ncbi:autotransporter domain-containing protein [Sphingopyxis sp. LARHCG72]